MTDFSDQFKKIIMRYKRIANNLNVMRQSACLVINPITVDSYAALFNCTSENFVSPKTPMFKSFICSLQELTAKIKCTCFQVLLSKKVGKK